jgi:flagellar biosynthesis/type III secretory pathway M-ring protein FliF/YscJ
VISAGSRYAEQAAALGAEPLTREEMDQQEQAIRAALDFDERRGRPYIARYEMETFVY